MDLSAKRELNSGFGNALSVAVELAVTPAVFAFLGWRLDAWLDTAPIFLVSFFLFVTTYVIWKQFSQYGRDMRAKQDAIPGLRRRSAGSGALASRRDNEEQ